LQFIDLKTQYDALHHEIHDRINRVLLHGQYIMGPEVMELERRLADFAGSRHCISVASGTDALLISLMGLGIGRDDEVITTPFTFAATVEVIVLLGAKPVFVDIERDTCNIDPHLVEKAITPRTKAIIPVSLYGQVADMDEINAIAGRHGGLPVIEDAAQSFGAEYKGRRSCNLSTVGCTSFFPSKPLGCYGDGGAIFTNDDELAQALREIRVHGQSARYVHTRVGIGGRMDTIQCAVVLAKLERFEWEIRRRQEIGKRYNDLLSAKGVSHVQQRSDRTSVFAQYTVFADDRDALRAAMTAAEIPSAIHYPIPLNEQLAYSAYCCPGCTPVSSGVACSVLSLPMGPDLSNGDQLRIVDVVARSMSSGSPVGGAC
jgi:UDP-2-acetamido-2-deoxy-ribo-hexuluronate aminotransferase